jgi:hypothetical protein
MMKNNANTCLNCRHAEWIRTITGRLSPVGYGKCGYRPRNPVLPKPVTAHHWPIYSSACISRRNPITDCPCWEAKGDCGEITPIQSARLNMNTAAKDFESAAGFFDNGDFQTSIIWLALAIEQLQSAKAKIENEKGGGS